MLVNEIFYSLQGEGLDVGIPATFLRLAKCNVRCSFCDTKYAFQDGREMTISEAMFRLMTKNKFIVVTGGEPLLQDEELGHLVELLRKDYYHFAVETNGTLPKPSWWKKVIWDVDCKCPSSGVKYFQNEWLSIGVKNRLKFVVSDKTDLEFASRVIDSARHFELCPTLLVSPVIPVEGASKSWLQEVWNFCVANNVRYSLQIHKFAWGNQKGV
jgi:7-carboxy-7-deazaguanine synthase